MKTTKRVLLSMFCIVLFSFSCMAALDGQRGIDFDEAKSLAVAYLGGGSVENCHYDNDGYQARYRVTVFLNGQKCEIELQASDGNVIQLHEKKGPMHVVLSSYSLSTNWIGEEAAIEIAQSYASAAVLQRCALEGRDENAKYKVVLVDGTAKHDFDIDALSGELRQYTIDYRYLDGAPISPQYGQSIIVDPIGMDQAQRIAETYFPVGQLVKCKLEITKHEAAYHLALVSGDKRYELEIDANGGSLLKSKQRLVEEKLPVNDLYNLASIIDEAQARDVAGQLVANGTIVKCELRVGKKDVVYKTVIVSDDLKHDVDINAWNGQIIRQHQKSITPFFAAPENTIGYDQAKRIALEQSRVGIVSACSYKENKGYPKFTVTVFQNGSEVEYDLDATNGALLGFEIRS